MGLWEEWKWGVCNQDVLYEGRMKNSHKYPVTDCRPFYTNQLLKHKLDKSTMLKTNKLKSMMETL